MRPLFHPAIDDITVEGILHALSDPVRVSIYAKLAALDGAATCTALQQVSDRTIPKSSLSQHFKVLRDAGLIHSERAGVEMRSTTRCKEIEQRFPGLIPAILAAHRVQSTQASPSRRTTRKTVAGAANAKKRTGGR
ncbi:helix-turn-helix domain-containing protein [Dyella sp. A6]|uniref:ArsR/SmtB family transcription factor n=1 Tax=Dyella aluminiiresistens TaxID=3069105 RepID=UPI002E773B4B|nr:helix-turn-helix domain-containing protein [Dyella sp. A6]